APQLSQEVDGAAEVALRFPERDRGREGIPIGRIGGDPPFVILPGLRVRAPLLAGPGADPNGRRSVGETGYVVERGAGEIGGAFQDSSARERRRGGRILRREPVRL